MTAESAGTKLTVRRSAPTSQQREAANPNVSAWVSANAGSGKTTVLTARVIRLLLGGARPAGILCLTFTKAAAANMQNKIFETLGDWVALENADLTNAIEDMTGTAPSATDLTTARRLFARAVETPGGLKVQTIHSFCERLLHQAPFEAGVPAHFEVMEDMDSEALLAQAITGTMRAALNEPGGYLQRALLTVSLEAGEDSAQKALRTFIRLERKRLSSRVQERKFANSGLSGRLDLTPGDTVDSVIQELRSGALYRGKWQDIRDWLKVSKGSRDQDKAKALTEAFRPDGGHIIDKYAPIFLTKEGQKLDDKTHFVTKTLRSDRPDLFEQMDDERSRVFDLMDKLRRVNLRDRSEAIRLVAEDAFRRYHLAKRQLGRLDFADLIEKAVSLLKSDAASWVLYKLDQGIDHILVDEAQDTSPEQWQIVKSIAGDFFSGAGARGESLRTLFAVGDEKQSIYGFQGARPKEFAEARLHFDGVIKAYDANRVAEREHKLLNLELQTSFRTGPDILTGVDTVFKTPENFAGLDSKNEAPQHTSNRDRDAGHIEIWEPIIGEKNEDPAPDDPVDALLEDSPQKLVSERIARTIRHWLNSGERFADDGLLIKPGDILILVRSRGPIFEQVIRALKQAQLPVAGADRLKVFSNIAVMDLLALGQICLLPEDDLSLASVLKSPLCGLDDTALERIAAKRGDVSLWDSLAKHATFGTIHQRLLDWRRQAAQLTPLEFYRNVLAADRGRAQLVGRLGPDAEEAITAFLATLRDWQSKNPASLALFLAHVAADERDVRRDMDEAHGRIRVMTAHGAKGLEARVVFLADTMHAMEGKADPYLMLSEDDPDSALWVPRSKDDPAQIAELRDNDKAARLEESRRLLYVALTRARDRLYIASARGATKAKNTWYDLVLEALKAGGDDKRQLAEIKDDVTGEAVWRWRDETLPVAAPVDVAASQHEVHLPDWLQQPVTADLPRPPPLRPSRLIDAAEPPAMERATLRRMEARLRGEAVHLLLQHMIGMKGADEIEAARRLLDARFPALDPALRDAAIADTSGLMRSPELAPLFKAEGRNEAAIAGVIPLNGKDIEVAGRVDRIAILPDAILIIDYKTGRPPQPGQMPETYLQQLAVYRALLANLFPGKPVRAAVIWTMAARADWLSDAELDAALARIGSQDIKVA